MNRDHVLIVSSDQMVPVTPDDAQLAQWIRSLLDAPNPTNTLQALFAWMDSLPDSLHIKNRLPEVIASTVDPIQDSLALQRLAHTLSGNVFTVTSGLGRTKPRTPTHPDEPSGPITVGNQHRTVTPSSTPISEEPVTIAHVNGILTDPLSALSNVSRIATIAHDMTWPAAIPFSVKLLYNPSTWTPPDQRQSFHICLSKLSARTNKLGVNSLPMFLAKCTGKTIKDVLLRFDDIREAAWQYVKVITNTPIPEPHAATIADSITQWRNEGQHIVFVPHSQGNMMVQQAIQSLVTNNRYNPPTDSTCIAAVSLAAPLSTHWPISNKHLSGLVVDGDFILSLKTNHFTRIKTQLADSAARDITKWESINPLIALYKRTTWGIKLHSFADSYLHDAGLRPQFESALSHAYGSCALNEITPSITELQPTQSRSLSVSLYDFNGNPLDGFRRLKWSLEPGTRPSPPATIDSTGLALASYAGTVGIRVATQTRSTSSGITVTPIHMPIDVTERGFTEIFADVVSGRISLGISDWSGGSDCNERTTRTYEGTTIVLGQLCQYQYSLSTRSIPTATLYEFLLFDEGSTSSYTTSLRTEPSASVDRFGYADVFFFGTGEPPKRFDRIHVFAKDLKGNLLGSGTTCVHSCAGWPK